MATQVTQEAGWIEKLEPELFKFEQPGQVIHGVFLNLITENAEGKQVPTYIIRLDSDKMIKLRGTHELLRKLLREDKGSFVKIEFKGQEKLEGREQSMMHYRVWIKPGPKRNGPEITDEDIPF